MSILKSPEKIIAVDSLGGLLVGLLTLALAGTISGWYGWSLVFTYYMGAVNLIYGSYSGLLWLRRRRSSFNHTAVILLVVANSAWLGHCLTQAWIRYDSLTVFGLVVLVFEGLYVASLAFIEARIVLPAAE